jgi:transcriptional regulator with XRE-family HTH domain
MGQIRDESLLKKIASRVKELRESKGISQEVFFIDTGIHIGRIETMKVNLSVSTLSHLCEYFEISLADFFKEIEKSNSSRKK